MFIRVHLQQLQDYFQIAHAGYLTIGLAAGNQDAVAGIIFYLAAYTFMNLGAFGIVAMIEGEEESNLAISSYAGLSSRKPLLAAMLALFMFSLAGIPPFAGFFGKYYVFIAAIKSNLTWLAIVGVFSSAISAYFYLRIVVLMYFKESTSEISLADSKTSLFAVTVASILVILLGIFPGSILQLITNFM